MNIIELIQKEVNAIAKTKFANDECPPEFIVSVLFERDMNEQKPILTIKHLGSSFSRILFPQSDSLYGYEELEKEVVSLYNQTM